MSNLPSYGSGVANWTPSTPKSSTEKAEKLMSTEASDGKDTMTGTNELKNFVGGSGKPEGPYGVQGRKF
jgi:hypothetical protein